jgi:L-ascorbate metabolism protein UlaG (beta-lactamase superfamily)
MRFRWLGVAGIELEHEGQTLVIDPFVSRFPFWRMWFGHVAPDAQLVAARIPRADWILVSHAHWDHLMDVPEVVRNTGATAFGSSNACQLLRVLGVASERVREACVGDHLELGSFEASVLPGQHDTVMGRPVFAGPVCGELRPPLRARDYRMDECFSFLIQAGGLRLLSWADTDCRGAPSADVLFCRLHEARDYYELLLRSVQPKVVIPVHWDDLFRPLSKPLRPMLKPPVLALPSVGRMDLRGFARCIEGLAANVRVLVPESFHDYELGHT